MLNCRDITERATDYTEGRLGFIERWKVRLHLAFCEACRRYLRQLQATVAALRHLSGFDGDEPSPEVQQALLESFRGTHPPPR